MTVHKLIKTEDKKSTSFKNIVLYTYAMSPYAAKVHCFLLYKKLDFSCFYINPLPPSLKKYLPVGKQIPVLSIDDESRADSTPIGLWLDEVFPDAPKLLPDNIKERDKLIAIDHWVSHTFIAHHFRNYPGVGFNLRRIKNAWKLGGVMRKTAHGGIPFFIFALWPLVLANVGFVKRMMEMADTDETLPVAREKLFAELVEKLEGGPFLGGRKEPSLPDFSAYPQLAIPYMIGFQGSTDFEAYPEIVAWLKAVQPYVEGGPALVPPVAVRNKLVL